MFRLKMILLSVFVSTGLFAQDAVVSGKVLSADQETVAGAEVMISGVRRQITSASDGSFEVKLAAGEHTIVAKDSRYGSAVEKVELEAGQTLEVVLTLDINLHEEIVVTGQTRARAMSETFQSYGVLDSDDLIEKMAPTIGEVLSEEPGVSTTYFGPGVGRPIIRGIGGDRIRILEDGIGVGDVSNTSPDHAISDDPISANRVEIIRGPGTLRYGSSAVGGVVNTIDGRIPQLQFEKTASGSVFLSGNSVADERVGAVKLNGSINKISWHAEYLDRETDDYEIPGFAELEGEEEHDEEEGHDEEEEVEGLLENSGIKSSKGTVGVSFVGNRGFVGVSYKGFDTNYGLPGHGHHAEDGHDEDGHDEDGHDEDGHDEEDESVSIDMKQRRFDIRGALEMSNSFFRGGTFGYAVTDYEHLEFEGDEVGTTYNNEFWELRTELEHREIGIFQGSIGLQISDRDFSALGAEAFVPPSQTERLGLFIVEEAKLNDNWTLNVGLRYDEQDSDADFTDFGHGHGHEDEEGEEHEEDEHDEDEHEDEGPEGPISRSHDGFSTAVGLIWSPDDDYSIALNLTRSEKLPNSEELFSRGPHLATDAFEIGDPDLDKETSTGFDVSFRRHQGRLTGELNVFSYQFDGYIYDTPTAEIEDGLTVFRYRQEDAQISGGELHFDLELFHVEPHHFHFEGSIDTVNATLDNSSFDLPRTPPTRYKAGLVYRGGGLWSRAEVVTYDSQDNIAEFETETDSFTLIHVYVGYRLFSGETTHDFQLRGTNLGDEEARLHTSFIKDRAPLPGRNLSLSYRLKF